MSRGDLTDDEWAVLEPLLPMSNNRCGRWRDHRQVINGIIHRLSTGCQWRKLPERFGSWQTVHKRHMLWSADGTWERLLQHVQAVADAAGDVDWNINIDSTSVRAHQHAAGPNRSAAGTAQYLKRGRTKISSHARAHAPAPVPGGGGASGEALGRSRSGLTTKIHLVVEQGQRPLALLITAGQRGDSSQFANLLDAIRVPRPRPGSPRTHPRRVRGDKAPHAAIRSSGRRERGWGGCAEGDRFVELLAVAQAVVELAEHAVEQVAEGGVVAVAGIPSAVVVGMGAG
ncbi:IS5 family transposase [Streptomyces sp. V1I1]|uniref:IS5 family transposase n=1 Tax=Streptomyces sp. V1I1 TaxID=3042272 RepID=UPI0035901076